MKCLVCGGPAADVTPAGFDGVAMDCPICQPYEVARSALRKLNRVDTIERFGALRIARKSAALGAPSSHHDDLLLTPVKCVSAHREDLTVVSQHGEER
jgi:hypothetical protein